MRRRSWVAVFTLALVLGVVAPALAVIWGDPDDGAHPQVGLVVFDVNGTPSHRCSGTLISERLLLTAGHCTFGTDAARVWFDEEVTDPHYPFSGGTAVDGTPYTHPGYDDFATFPNTSDVGVVVLDQAVKGLLLGQLAAVGTLDDAARKPRASQEFTIVGYGLQNTLTQLQADRARYKGHPMLVELGSALTDGWNIHFSSNNGNNSGGACFGDSGGPAFLGGDSSRTVVGVGSFVLNDFCVGAGYYYRVDTAHAQDWISGFLTTNSRRR
jgi:hypothetical protein